MAVTLNIITPVRRWINDLTSYTAKSGRWINATSYLCLTCFAGREGAIAIVGKTTSVGRHDFRLAVFFLSLTGLVTIRFGNRVYLRPTRLPIGDAGRNGAAKVFTAGAFVIVRGRTALAIGFFYRKFTRAGVGIAVLAVFPALTAVAVARSDKQRRACAPNV